MSKRILVLVKQVPTTESVRLNEETGTMIRTGSDAAINPLDLHAVEEAVRIKESASGPVHIIVLSMGPSQAQSAIREALAMGCDEGILLSGREFAGADTWATAYTLVQGMRKLEPLDLVLCGERATDGETGQVGPMVAAMWGKPLLTYVSKLTWSGEAITTDRAIEGGTETVSCPLPALACVLRELNEPRLPTLAGKVAAHDADIAILDGEGIDADVASLGLGGSPTRVVKVVYPSFQRVTELFNAADEGLPAALDRMEVALRHVSAHAEDAS
ncbi:electron transfer flavoprotein subunit beta/FixA family protein [Candidatus Bipolaricaulota bacterium]|nr:electron transfer flavoprotein subunit beta/FixA family protein [Candidatus Bipolaricaulota bacterium]